MSNDSTKQIDAIVTNQKPDSFAKRISFKKETYRNLVTIASREYFDSKLKPDEMISEILDKIINEYYIQYWNQNKPF